MWYQKDGCATQYRCYISYYLMSFLSKSHQIVLDRAIDTLGHGKYVVDDFKNVQKRYSATCLRMRSMSGKDKIDSKRMRVDAMNEMER